MTARVSGVGRLAGLIDDRLGGAVERAQAEFEGIRGPHIEGSAGMQDVLDGDGADAVATGIRAGGETHAFAAAVESDVGGGITAAIDVVRLGDITRQVIRIVGVGDGRGHTGSHQQVGDRDPDIGGLGFSGPSRVSHRDIVTHNDIIGSFIGCRDRTDLKGGAAGA